MRKLYVTFVLCCWVALLSVAGCDRSALTITGTVTNKDGSPAANVEIRGGDGIAPEESAPTYTDSAGHYVLHAEGTGWHYVIVIQDEREIARHELEVESNHPNIADITLPD